MVYFQFITTDAERWESTPPCVNFPHEWNLVSMLNNLLEFELKLLKFHITSGSEIVAQWIVLVKHSIKITQLPSKKLLLRSSGIEGNGLRKCNFKTWKYYVKSIDVQGTIYFSDISGLFFLFWQQQVLNSTKPVKNKNKYLIYCIYQLYKICLWNIKVSFKR